jgi:pyrimidine-nucleoside phosphorylase
MSDVSATLLIRKVQEKKTLSKDEIFSLIRGFEKGDIPDYQMSAFLMAVYYQGVSQQEKEFLTSALLTSGKQMEWPEGSHYVDKHSTGGTGDKTSLILAPLLAALGYKVPMMSGRGLGHTGGTLDKLESLKGLSTDLSLKDFEMLTEKHNLSFIGQTKELCPADKKLYALRDVTCTVSSIPLITASIVSKKIAEGVKGLVYDVKTGSGAFIKDFDASKKLAESLVETSKGLGAQSVALITDMSQPLGRYVGNTCEMYECFEIMKDPENNYKAFEDTVELTLHLTARLVHIYESNSSYDEVYQKVKATLWSKKPYEIALSIFKDQGWNGDMPKLHDKFIDWSPKENGHLKSMNNEQVGWASVALGAGRKVLTDQVDPDVGFYFYKKIGDEITSDEPLVRIYYNSEEKLKKSTELLAGAFVFSKEKVAKPKLIQDVIYGKKEG